MRQFEPICKFHWIEAFNDEMTFQDLSEAFSSLEKPEPQSPEYNDAADTGKKPYALKGENPMETRISENQDQLVHEHVRKSKSLSLNYYRGETQPLMEKSLARSTVVDVAFNTSQPQPFLCRENVCASGESSFDTTEDCLDVLDLRTDHETEVRLIGGVIKACGMLTDTGVFLLFKNTQAETFQISSNRLISSRDCPSDGSSRQAITREKVSEV